MAFEPASYITLAQTSYMQLADSSGRLILIPTATVESLLSGGVTSTTFADVNLRPGQPARPWLSVSDAARLCLDDVDGMTLERAKARISRGCDSGRIVSDGHGAQRRVEPNSLDSWRLAERERNLGADDKPGDD